MIDQGLLAKEQFIDATVVGQLQAAQEQVSEIVNKNIDEASENVKAFEDDVFDAQFGMIQLAKTIDDTIQGHMDSAINALQKLPEAARVTGQQYTDNLIDNIAIASEFEDLINQLAERGQILLAKNLADQGVGMMNVARDFLNNPALAASNEAMLQNVVPVELALQAAEQAQKHGEVISEAVNELSLIHI